MHQSSTHEDEDSLYNYKVTHASSSRMSSSVGQSCSKHSEGNDAEEETVPLLQNLDSSVSTPAAAVVEKKTWVIRKSVESQENQLSAVTRSRSNQQIGGSTGTVYQLGTSPSSSSPVPPNPFNDADDITRVYDISTPIRPRARIWAAFGQSGSEHSFRNQLSRSPFRNQENVGCPHDQIVSDLLSQNIQGYSETDPLLHRASNHARRPQSSQGNVNLRQSCLGSLCSTADLEASGTPSSLASGSFKTEKAAHQSNGSYHPSRREFFEKRETNLDGTKKVTYILQTSGVHNEDVGGSGDEVLSSTDSHCHSNNKKGGFDKKARTRLIIASILCLLFMTGEMVGGLLAHSLAIISDAAHLLTDFASFMISLMALYLAHRPATKKLSFGWYRIEILGAFVSILMLWVLTGILVYSAVLRIMEDSYEIDATIMLITAATGVAFNVVLGVTLHQHGHSHGGGHGHSHGGNRDSDSSDHSHEHAHSTKLTKGSQALTTSGAHNYGSFRDIEPGEQADPVPQSPDCESEGHSHHTHIKKPTNINVKAAFIHVLGDLFQSVGVLVAAFIIFYKPEWKIADPICTFLFSLFVLITTITIMRDIVVVLMEGTPRGINFTEVRNTFFEVDGVLDIHNLRVWSLTMDKIALSVHLAVDKQSDPHRVLKLASMAIKQKFNISETTMQIEEYVTEMIDCQDCQGP